MQHNIAMISDYGYLTRTLLLYESICRHEPTAHVYLLALDDKTFHVGQSIGQSNLTVTPLSKVETAELTAARQGRNWVEWVWLFQPAFPLHLMKKYDIGHIFWMDGDMWLFDSLKEMFNEIGSADVAISPHRFPPLRAGSVNTVSIYNGGATYFRNTERGRACCQKWLADCIEWDYWWSQPKPGPKRGQKGGTQGYLDSWPEEWGARVVQHLGCNLAPWNQDHPDYHYEFSDGKITVNGQPLLFYHYQDFKPERDMLAGPGIVPFVVEYIYRPYVVAYTLKQKLWQPTEKAKDVKRKA